MISIRGFARLCSGKRLCEGRGDQSCDQVHEYVQYGCDEYHQGYELKQTRVYACALHRSLNSGELKCCNMRSAAEDFK
eukprot:7764041-Karenia_brevis.AAC.1